MGKRALVTQTSLLKKKEEGLGRCCARRTAATRPADNAKETRAGGTSSHVAHTMNQQSKVKNYNYS